MRISKAGLNDVDKFFKFGALEEKSPQGFSSA